MRVDLEEGKIALRAMDFAARRARARAWPEPEGG